MARVRDESYDIKRDEIKDRAANLFAEVGYPNAKMMDVAEACGASKSMLYHYFTKKDDLLYEILFDHLNEMLLSIEAIVKQKKSGISGRDQFRAFVELYVEKSPKMRTRHVVAMLDVKFLPVRQQTKIKKMERQVMEYVADLLRAINPKLADELYKSYALLLIGMVNGMDMWYKQNGKVPAEEMCERVSRLFLQGFLSEE